MDEVEIYSWGLINCSACAPFRTPMAEVEAEVNKKIPTGISSKWRIIEAKFADGSPNPTLCSNFPGSRLHYLLTC